MSTTASYSLQKISLKYFCFCADNPVHSCEKGKPFERQGRKASDLSPHGEGRVAGLLRSYYAYPPFCLLEADFVI